MSSSNCCFLTCTQISQEAGKVVWYLSWGKVRWSGTAGSHLLKNFPQFVVVHAGKGFVVVNEAEVGVFLEVPCFFYEPVDVGNLISGSSALSRCSLNIWKLILSITLLACEMKRWVQLCGSLDSLWHCLSLVLEWKLTFSSPMATAEFFKFAGILSAALSQHHLLGLEIAQLGFHHLQLPTSNLFEK